MAAGLGFKTFTTGEVLTAADTNGYLMQGVLVFASSAARAAALTSPQEGQYSYLKDTNSTEYYDGAAWIAAPIGDITGVTAGTGISGGGTSGTVTITNSMATEIAAKGDLIVGTGAATFDNLTVGANGTTLVADSPASTGLKWATPAAASSGLTLVTRSTFSNVASVTIDSIFTSTYKTYLVVIENIRGDTSNTQDLGMQFRYGAVTQASGCYSTAVYWATGTSATAANVGANNTTYFNLNKSLGGAASTGTIASLTIGNVGQASEYAMYYGAGTDYNDQLAYVYAGSASVARTYTGLVFLPDSGNISGEISIYGLATS